MDRCSQLYNASVAACTGIDPFCSRTDWIIPFYKAFTPENRLHLWQEDNSFVLLSENKVDDIPVLLTPLEAMWGFPCPLIGPEAPAMLAELLGQGRGEENISSGHLMLCGLPDNRSALHQLVRQVSRSHDAFLVEPTHRCVASLEGGVNGFLSRRSRKFRVNLQKALQRTQDQGICFRRISILDGNSSMQQYRRILAVERRSWKGLSGNGIDRPPMKTFYRLMLKRIAPAGMLRLIMAERDGRNIGYIYGAVIGKYYRGLQFSFDHRFAYLSPGNVLQYRMIEWLCEEGCRYYDLGSVVPYKKHWSELDHQTISVYLRRRQG